ncbi:PLP-dependent aminotransferase family protein [Sphingosinicella sp. BN140058]|uniref:aminotransferase-like domain-containing protein n=1 Tax=Sphingosinicella sp. BN140058 TaxID=1892855 RepID=UPI0010106F70|nr:PLP-dependent aminotransferase family protein [Sphingosinicella sp. BN140058]QAY76980.1 PLP-dependent aminotransferase family protein [Sphingosinicella sp. BN140058]
MVRTPVRTTSKVAQVMDVIRHRVERRQLTPGARIPSVRAMAETLTVSKSTVVEAYDRLAAEGLVEGRPGSGFYVAAPLAPLRLLPADSQTDPTVDPLWTMRQSLRPSGTGLRPGCGWLPESWMPEDALRRALRTLARDGRAATLLEYGSPQGDETLRTLIARRMADQGVEAGPDQVLLTDSGSHAIDLICRFLLESGDTVLVDDPCYFNFHTVLRAHRAKVVGVPYTPTGPDLTAFRTAVEAQRPRLYITNAALHNPTGATLSAAAAHRILKIAEAHDMVVVEDDIFGDFEAEPAPRLAAFDGLDRVIRIGSFSKTLSASVRCGHIAARSDWIAGLTDLRLATGMASSPLAAALLVSVLTDGSYRRHVERVRAQLARRRGPVLDRLGALGIDAWHVPSAGMFLWCRLPPGCDSADVARIALAEDVVLAPGNAFSVGGGAADFMRFNISQMDDRRIDGVLAEAVARLR